MRRAEGGRENPEEPPTSGREEVSMEGSEECSRGKSYTRGCATWKSQRFLEGDSHLCTQLASLLGAHERLIVNKSKRALSIFPVNHGKAVPAHAADLGVSLGSSW